MEEVKRLINIRFIAMTAVILFANALFLIRDNYTQKDVFRVYDELILLAEENKSSEMTNKEAVVEAYNDYKEKHNIESGNIPDNLKEARRLLNSEAEYIDGYKDELSKKIDTATKLTKAGFYKRDSFENINMLKTKHDMNKLKDIDVKLSNGHWLNRLYNYSYIQIFSVIILAITIYSFFTERKTGLYYIIHTAANGRAKLFFKRVAIISIEALSVNVILYMESIWILLNIYGGVKSVNDLAANDEMFFLVSGSHTRIEMVVIFILVSTITAIALSLLLWFVLSLFNNINMGMCVYIVVCVIFVIIYMLISTKSPIRFAHYLNIYYWFYPHKLVVYHNWGYSFGVTSLMTSMLVFTSVLCAVLLLSNFIINIKKYFAGRSNVAERFIEANMFRFMRILVHAPQFLKEIYKIFISQKVIFALVVLMYFVVKIDVGNGIGYSMEMGYLAKYYDKAAGMRYSPELEEIYHEYELEFEDFKAGLNEDDENYLAKIAARESLLFEIRNNIDYVKALNEKGISAEVVRPYEYERVFGAKEEENQKLIALINVIAVIVIAAGYISYERKNKISQMAMSYAERRKWLVKKIFVNMFLASLFLCASYGIYYYKLFSVYKIASFSAHINSIPMFVEYPVNVSVLEVIIIDSIVKLIALFCIIGIISILSKYITYLYCLLAGLIIVFPQLLSMMGFRLFDNLSIGKYIAFFPCFNAGGLTVVIFAATIVFLLIVGVISYTNIVAKLVKN